MTKLAELAGKNLIWAPVTGEKKHYELRDGDEVVGKLGMTENKVLGEIGDDKWTFSKQGFFRPRLSVHRDGEDKACGVLEVGALASGRLTLDGKDSYRWMQQGMFSSRWGFATDGKEIVVDFKLDTGLLSTSGEVSFGEKMADDPVTPLLLVLGWYVLTLYAEDVVPAGL